MSGFYHSAEGSHWTKKNHKYIRKEGNRYIYPEDLKRMQNTANARRDAVNSQSSANYRQLSEQHANRQAAKSGKVVNPSYVVRDSSGNKVYEGTARGRYAMPTTSDYKEYSRDMAQYSNRKRAKNGNGARNQEYAKAATQGRKDQESLNELKRSNATYNQGSNNYSRGLSNRRTALNNQGSSDYKSMGVNYAKRRAAAGNTSDANLYNTSQDYAKHKSKLNSKKSKDAALAKRQAENRQSSLNSQGSSDYRQLSSGHANRGSAVNSQSSSDYKKLSEQRANRTAALKNQASSDYRTISENKAKRSKALKSQVNPDYKQLSAQQANRKSSVNNQASSDYKRLSEQHANRQAAKSGKIVNPTYKLVDSEGNTLARVRSKEKVPSANVNDYKNYSREVAQYNNRKKAANGSADKGHYGGYVKDARSDQQYAKDTASYRKKKSLNERLDRENTMKQKSREDATNMNPDGADYMTTKYTQADAKRARSRRVKNASDRARKAYEKREAENKRLINKAKRAFEKLKTKKATNKKNK